MNTIGIALVWCAVQVTLMALLASGLYILVRRPRPAAAATVVLTGLVMVVILSLLALSPWPRWTVRGPAPTPDESLNASLPSPGELAQKVSSNSPLPQAGEGQGVRAAGVDMASSRAKPSSAALFWQALVEELSRPQTTSPASAWRWPAVVAALLLAAMACGLGRLVLGVAAVRWQRLRSRPLPDATLSELIAGLRAELGCRRPIEVRQCDNLATAATIGWLRPVILLPADWPDWTADQRRAVVAHEIGHVRSHDFLALLCGQLGLVLHFYHPLLHWLMGRLRLEQELAADAAAAGVCGGQRQYLATIAELALRQQDRPLWWPAHTFLPTRTTFLRRIAMLRDSKLRFDRRSPAARALAAGAVVLCGLLAAGVRGPSGQPQVLAADPAKAPPQAPGNAFIPGNIVITATQPAADRIDLQFVPATAVGFAAVRPAAIFQRPELAEFGKVLNENPDQVVPPTDIEQFTGVLLSLPEKFPAADRDMDALAIYQTTKPAPWEAWLRRMPDAQKKEFEGKTYFVGLVGRYGGAVFRPNDRTLVWAFSEKTLHKFFQAPKGLPKFVDAKSWEQFQGDHAVAAVEAKTLEQAMLLKQQETPQAMTNLAPFSPLWQDTVWGIGGARIGLPDGTQLNVTGNIPPGAGVLQLAGMVYVHALAMAKNENSAEKVKETLNAARVLAVNASKTLQRPGTRGPGAPPTPEELQSRALGLLGSFLSDLAIERDGAAVLLHNTTRISDIQKVLPSIAVAREAARKSQSKNNLKQLALAMVNYLDANRHFPPAVLYGPDGKTPYSWRVALLPYLEQKVLYDQYRFDEPWDGPNNRKLLEKMPAVFRCPSEPAESKNASYFALVGPGTIFEGTKGTAPREILDGMSRTLLLVEAKRDIPWTKPEDIVYDPDKPLPELGGYFPGGFCAALADGSVRLLPSSIDEKVLRLLITKADRQAVQIPPDPDAH